MNTATVWIVDSVAYQKLAGETMSNYLEADQSHKGVSTMKMFSTVRNAFANRPVTPESDPQRLGYTWSGKPTAARLGYTWSGKPTAARLGYTWSGSTVPSHVGSIF